MIKVRNLKKSFDSIVFDNLNVDINAHINYIKGGNGTGKTTLLNIISGDDCTYQGQVYYQNITAISYVSQVSNLLPNLSFKQNIEVFTDGYDSDKLNYLLRIFDLDGRYKSSSKISKFSGGEQKKVQLVVSLLQTYDLLILDEVDNHLDERSIYTLIEYIKNEPQMVIIVSHSLEDYFDSTDYQTISLDNPPSTNCEIIELPVEFQTLNLTTEKLNVLNKLNENMMILICVSMLVISLAFSYLTFGSLQSIAWELEQADTLDLKFENNSSLIYPPAFSDYFFEFGDISQLQTTKLYFTQDNYNQLLNIPGVEKIIPITDKNAAITTEAYEQDGILYTMLGPPVGQLASKYSFSQLRLPNEIMSNIPTVYYINGHNLVAGTIPQDNSNQILVDTNYADQLMQEFSISSYEQLIGKVVSIPVINFETRQQTEIDFIVSGVIDTLQESIVYVASNTNSEYYQKNVEYWKSMTGLDVKTKMDDVVEYVLNGDYSIYQNYYDPHQNYYMGFYIELSDNLEEQQFVQMIDDYDQYIQVLNTYTVNHTPVFKYLRSTIYKNLIIIIFGVCLLICLESLLFKYLLNSMERINQSLKFYKVRESDIDKYNQITRSKLNVNVLIGLVLGYIITIYYSYQTVPSITISIIFIAIYAIGFISILAVNKLISKKEKK